MSENAPRPLLPDILAQRYASAAMLEVWSPEGRIVLERELWIAVMKAQAALGVDKSPGAYQPEDAWGFIHLNALPLKMAHRQKKKMEEPSEWPPSDRVVKKWEAHGFLCAISRGSLCLCGYVCIPDSHPWAGRDLEDFAPLVSVHGGLTWSSEDG